MSKEEILKESIWFLGLHKGILNVLFNAGVETIDDLSKMTGEKLLRIGGIDGRTLTAIDQALWFWGISLAKEEAAPTHPEPCRCIDVDDISTNPLDSRQTSDVMVLQIKGIGKYSRKRNIIRCLKNLYKGYAYFLIKDEFDEPVVLIDVVKESWGTIRNYKYTLE